jgi:hypothetical protein
MDLRGAVALVTGGHGGLGQRIRHALAAAQPRSPRAQSPRKRTTLFETAPFALSGSRLYRERTEAIGEGPERSNPRPSTRRVGCKPGGTEQAGPR